MNQVRFSRRKWNLTNRRRRFLRRKKRYRDAVENRIGPVWYRLSEIYNDELHVGTVETTFEIPPEGGAVRNLKIVSDSGGRMDLLIARRAIDQLRPPPIPPDLLRELNHDILVVMEESFTVFYRETPPRVTGPVKINAPTPRP